MRHGRFRKVALRVLAIVAVVALFAADAVAAEEYEVQRGDTLSEIAERHNTSMGILAHLNGISNVHRIYAGQRLTVPSDTYTVRRGDVLSRIAREHRTSTQALVEANNLSSRHLIYPGQVLKMPAGVTSSQPTFPNLPSMITNSSTRMAMIPYFVESAAEFNLPVDLLMALCWQESGWRESADNPASTAYGVCQILRGTAIWINQALLSPDETRFNAKSNIRMGARYLAWLMGEFDTEWLAVVAYHDGIGAVQRNGVSTAGRNYANNVEALRRFFR